MEKREIRKKQFCGDKFLRSYVIPEGVVEIGDWAFAGCAELRRLEMPMRMEYIGREAFAGCDKLEEVFLYGDSLAQAWEKGNRYAEIMAFALRFFSGAADLIRAWSSGEESGLLAWDKACRLFLIQPDDAGVRPFLAGGEEDYEEDARERQRRLFEQQQRIEEQRRIEKEQLEAERLREQQQFIASRKEENDLDEDFQFEFLNLD